MKVNQHIIITGEKLHFYPLHVNRKWAESWTLPRDRKWERKAYLSGPCISSPKSLGTPALPRGRQPSLTSQVTVSKQLIRGNSSFGACAVAPRPPAGSSAQSNKFPNSWFKGIAYFAHAQWHIVIQRGRQPSLTSQVTIYKQLTHRK
jgi:hypothetical protein